MICVWNLSQLDEYEELLQKVKEYETYETITTLQTPKEISAAAIISACFLRRIEGEQMTPQEELFSKLFNHEKALVKDMDMLTLRAHREELANIAFEARARLTAVDDEENGRKKKRSNGGVEGFERSVNQDETSTNAINAIKERQKKLSKKEQVIQGLKKLYEMSGGGVTAAETSKLVEAGTILGRIKQKPNELDGVVPAAETEKKPVFNPFEKKEG